MTKYKLGQVIPVYVRTQDGVFALVSFEVTHFTRSGKLILKDDHGDLSVLEEAKVDLNLDGPAPNSEDWIHEMEVTK